MRKYRRITEAEQAQIWNRLQAGESIRTVAAAHDRVEIAIRYVVARTGGVRPRPRKVRECALSPAEREEISRGLAAHQSCRIIAAALSRSPSTVSREVERNGGRGRYRGCDAERRARVRARRSKPATLA